MREKSVPGLFREEVVADDRGDGFGVAGRETEEWSRRNVAPRDRRAALGPAGVAFRHSELHGGAVGAIRADLDAATVRAKLRENLAEQIAVVIEDAILVDFLAGNGDGRERRPGRAGGRWTARFDALLCLDGDLFANVAERRGWVGDATQQRVERRGDVRVVGFYGYAGASHAKLSLSCVAAVPTDKSIGTQDAGGDRK